MEDKRCVYVEETGENRPRGRSRKHEPIIFNVHTPYQFFTLLSTLGIGTTRGGGSVQSADTKPFLLIPFLGCH